MQADGRLIVKTGIQSLYGSGAQTRRGLQLGSSMPKESNLTVHLWYLMQLVHTKLQHICHVQGAVFDIGLNTIVSPAMYKL